MLQRWCGRRFGKPAAANFTEGFTVGYAEKIGKRQLFYGLVIVLADKFLRLLGGRYGNFFIVLLTLEPEFAGLAFDDF